MRYLLILLISILGIYRASAQSCTIVSDSFMCLGDFETFKVNVSGASASSWAWTFGDGQSSQKETPFVGYTAIGSKTVTVVVGLSSGGTCTATKKMFVHALPVAEFVLDSLGSNFCFYKNNICLTNKSKPGATNSPLQKDLILWGDGSASNTNNPQYNSKTCHRYNGVGPFRIDIEVTDTKGCRSMVSKKVTVVQDVLAQFSFNADTGCKQAKVCFQNHTPVTPSFLKRFYWNFGDKHIDSINWLAPCFTYTYSSAGNYKAQLVIETKEGCVDTATVAEVVKLDTIVFDVVKDQYEACLRGGRFVFQDKGPHKDSYYWFVRDSGDIISNPFGQGSTAVYTWLEIGKQYISLTAWKGNCKATFAYDSVDVLGPEVDIETTNASLCHAGSDSTYFCDRTNYYKSYHSERLWDFGDLSAPGCTTDTKKGVNVGAGCRFSRDENPAFMYKKDGCYTVKLWAKDSLTGCEDDKQMTVQIGAPNTKKLVFTYGNENPCTGNSIDRIFSFRQNSCNRYYINPDSANPKSGFIPMLLETQYDTLSHPEGWVTVGVILQSGEDPASWKCKIPGDSTRCYDTIWYHNFFRLTPQTKPSFKLNSTIGCIPHNATLTPEFPVQPFLSMARINWGDGTSDSLNLSPGDTLPVLHHTYTKNGNYKVTYSLLNTTGCEDAHSVNLTIGHSAIVHYDTTLCPGALGYFFDTVRYFNDTINYWWMGQRRIDKKEGYLWDFGDGGGFTKFEPFPWHIYQSAGLYHARMVTFDSMGCYDTAYFDVKVRGIDAGIRQPKGSYLCSEILQLFDSSVLIDPFGGDKIRRYTWDFGDGSRQSNLKDPWHYYSTFGDFKVKLTVMNSRGCTDTDSLILHIRGPEPLFRFASDSVGCAPFEVELENISSNVRNWIWHFGDPANSTYPTDSNKNVKFRYETPGVYYLHLYGADSVFNSSTGNWQFCAAVWPDSTQPFAPVKKVVVLPIPPADFFIPDTVCAGQEFMLVDKSDPKYDKYQWDLDDDIQITGNKSILHKYDSVGLYLIKLHPTYSPDGTGKECFDSASKPLVVIDVKAEFEIDTLQSFLSNFHFLNRSQHAVRYEWDFGQPWSGHRNFSRDKDPWHNYAPHMGKYTVCLRAYNTLDCVDTFCLELENTFKTHIFIPNVITPGNPDNYNDEFEIEIDGEESYDLIIVNRWGQTVFKGNADAQPGEGINWNGTAFNNGKVCPAGVYYVIFRYNFYFEEPVQYNGTLTIIR